MLSFIADPNDLATLSSVLEEYCSQHLVIELSDRDECARQILALYSTGVTSRQGLLDKMNGIAAKHLV